MKHANRYEQWVAAGRPYREGLALFRATRKLPALAQSLARRETRHNARKLDTLLERYLKKVPAIPSGPPHAVLVPLAQVDSAKRAAPHVNTVSQLVLEKVEPETIPGTPLDPALTWRGKLSRWWHNLWH